MGTPSNPRQPHGVPRRGRSQHLIEEREHDAYRSTLKLHDAAWCSQCQAVYNKGRWQWAARPEDSRETLCPACARMRDKVPAGYLTVSGGFYRDHRDEIWRLIERATNRERAAHPMKRLMDAQGGDEEVVLTLSDPHLVASIGNALRNAYKGDLHVEHVRGEYLVRGHWSR